MRNLKKVLALVLALVMTMSLVTIANAAEFTDADDISYEEAVDVMSAIGVLEGFEDGSFQPGATLTREQAAKIICTMLLGDNAEKLGTATSSFSDVPSTRWSAPYIAYCASLGIIAGNGDGTYNPTGTLTGYAFAKMLLGAVGYDATIEGFVGAGWNLKVAAMASKAGLLNDLQGFVGSDAITREQASQMALNTLKATLVEYTGTTIDVSAGDANVTIGNTQYSYVVSNNKDVNRNINADQAGNQANYYTLEFGEQHFPNLKLVSTNTLDDFGNPANQWSLSNVTIGKYAKTPAFTYTAAASGDTTADQVKSMGLKDYSVASGLKVVENGKTGAAITSVNDIPKYTGNGTKVMVYTSEQTADLIIAVVVIKTQLMQINSVKSDAVTLKEVDDDQDLTTISFMKMAAVEDDDDCYETLSAMKADDYVLVTPLWNGTNYSAYAVAEPTVVTGLLTKISTKASDAKVKSVDVDGTTYTMSAMWTSKDGELNYNTKLTSTKDCVIYVDSYGYAIYATDVISSNSVIVIDEIYSSLVDGKIIKYAQGWDAKGNAISLNLGTNPTYPDGYTESTIQGATFEYTSQNVSSSAEYKLVAAASSNLVKSQTGYVKAGAATATIGSKSYYYASDVKFIFLSKNGTDVTGITVNDGVCEVGSATTQYALSYVFNGNGEICAVVVPNDNDAANTANLLYVSAVTGRVQNSAGTVVPVFTAYINGEKVENCQYNKSISDPNALADKFYTYSETDGVYTLNEYTKTGKATSVITADELTSADIPNNTYFTNKDGKVLNAKNAVVIDLVSSDGISYNSLKEMKDGITDKNVGGFKVSYVYNGSDGSGANTVSYIFITKNLSVGSGSGSGSEVVTPGNVTTTLSGSKADATYTVASNGALRVTLDYTAPAYAVDNTTVSFDLEVYADGKWMGTLANFASNTALTDSKVQIVGNGSSASYPTNEQLTFKIVNEKVAAVEVKYVDETGADLTSRLDAGYTAQLSTTAGAAISFTIDTSSNSKTLKYSLSGTDQDFSEKSSSVADDQAQKIASSGSSGNITTTADPKALGTGYVTVTIKGLNSITETYSITAEDTNLVGASAPTGEVLTDFAGAVTGETAKLILTVSKDASIGKGESVTLSMKLDKAADKAPAYKVTIKVNGQTFTGTTDGTTPVDLGRITNIQSNLKIMKADVTLEPIASIAVTGAVWNGTDTVTLTFNRPVDKTTGETTTNYTWEKGTASNTSAIYSAEVQEDGYTVVLTFSGEALKAGNTITLVANIEDDDYSTSKVTAQVITLKEGNTCDVTARS